MGRTARGSVLAAAGVVLSLTAGACGASSPGSHASSDASGSASADLPSQFYPRPEMAANAFSNWFYVDADDCQHPSISVRNHLPAKLLAAFSCDRALTADDQRLHCQRQSLVATGPASGAGPNPVTVSPSRKKYRIGWTASSRCDGGEQRTDKGTYEVEVQKASGGWYVDAFRILTGAGAGTKG